MTRVPGHADPSRSEAPERRATRHDQAPDQDWVGLGEASRLLGISHGTLRRWADEGRVAVFVTPGGHRRFSRHVLRSLLPAARSRRPSLARLGASPERIARAYRPAPRQQPSPREVPEQSSPRASSWLDVLEDEDRTAFRARGREIVTVLLDYLDATGTETRTIRLQEACRLAAQHGRRIAELGASMTEAVETFLRVRTPFVTELAGIARHRGLDTREATELLVQADEALDRLLVATMTGHSLAAVGRRRRRTPAAHATAAVGVAEQPISDTVARGSAR